MAWVFVSIPTAVTRGDRQHDEDKSPGPGNAAKRKPWGWMLTGGAALLLASATGFAGGFGSQLADLVGSSSDPPLVSSSDAEFGSECIRGTFVPDNSAKKVLRQGPPEDWKVIEQLPGSAYADHEPVQVSIQGESARTITLTRIDFRVIRRALPPGAAFRAPCGGPSVGRALEVDLDADPPRIVDSSAEQHGMLGSRGLHGERLTQPIRFPWTVSLTDPLLLDVIATTSSCYCVWSAEIPWVSGAHHGTIQIDNHGDGYRVAGTDGVPSYSPDLYGDQGWISSQS